MFIQKKLLKFGIIIFFLIHLLFSTKKWHGHSMDEMEEVEELIQVVEEVMQEQEETETSGGTGGDGLTSRHYTRTERLYPTETG